MNFVAQNGVRFCAIAEIASLDWAQNGVPASNVEKSRRKKCISRREPGILLGILASPPFCAQWDLGAKGVPR
jgi:hypothetical protein